ncbi:unnamed protein product [Gemmataceae bacterium]|nr:unnamed protein product [Gemmataceae bacterium]VTT99078.1 unnamed protein product [Gemmataceae bacterium]
MGGTQMAEMGNAAIFASGSLTISGLEKEFSIKKTRAYVLMQEGKLPFSKAASGRRLIPRAAVMRLLAEGLVQQPHVTRVEAAHAGA